MIHFLLSLLHPLNGQGYQFWSGLGSDLGEVTLLATLWKMANCQEPGCWRIGHRHPDPDHRHHGRPVCARHWKESA